MTLRSRSWNYVNYIAPYYSLEKLQAYLNLDVVKTKGATVPMLYYHYVIDSFLKFQQRVYQLLLFILGLTDRKYNMYRLYPELK